MQRTLTLAVLILCMFPLTVFAQPARPNVVLVFMDNLGWGELGTYGGGILRGAPTPRIDALADEGLKLLNFNVEAQCTPSRAALMTGRYAIRTGNASIPLEVGEYGLTQWEYTMAEMLSEAGYATGMFGKWHLGDSPGRYPTDQGFNEWFGIPNSSDESYWPDNDLFRPGVHPQAKYEYVMEAQRGQTPKELEVFNSARRLTIDRAITDRAIDYMRRMAAGTKPFFLFVPYTQTHLPVEPHPDYKGKTGNGHWADVLAQTDAYVGELLDAVDKLGIKDNTIFIFTADNGPEGAIPHQGFSGPWRGSYFTGLEASLRVPFLIRWPGRIPSRRVSNDIVHEMDLFATFARIAGGKVPGDRVIDSVDQTDFFTGTATKSNRESVVIYVGSELYGVKWRDWKMMVKEVNTIGGDPVRSYGVPLFYNLLLDPKEEHPVLNAPPNLWVRFPASQVLVEHARSLRAEPPIPPGTPDPYRPSR
jgi:arylsulfatase